MKKTLSTKIGSSKNLGFKTLNVNRSLVRAWSFLGVTLLTSAVFAASPSASSSTSGPPQSAAVKNQKAKALRTAKTAKLAKSKSNKSKSKKSVKPQSAIPQAAVKVEQRGSSRAQAAAKSPQASPQARAQVATTQASGSGELSALSVAPSAQTLRADAKPKSATQTSDDPYKLTMPKIGSFTPIFQIKNTLDLAKRGELETVGGKASYIKNELFIGAKHDSGWGLRGTMAVTSESYDKRSRDRWDNSDSSAILDHPKLYKGEMFSQGGFFRVYFPTTESSSKAGKYRYRYNFGSELKFSQALSLSNDLSVNNYTQTAAVKPDTTRWMITDELQLTYKLNKFASLGAGSDYISYLYEKNEQNARVDLYPELALMFGNFTLYSRYYFPVQILNQGDGGKDGETAALDYSYAEFLLKLAI